MSAASGPAISIIGGHGDVNGFRPEVIEALAGHNTCTGAPECAARVRELARAGAQVIKFTATGGVLSQQARGLEAHFTDEEMRAIVNTAHSLTLMARAASRRRRGPGSTRSSTAPSPIAPRSRRCVPTMSLWCRR